MSLTNKNEKSLPKVFTLNHQSESKKIILIELTSVLLVAALILFKTIIYFWPEEFWPTVSELQDFVLSLESWLSDSHIILSALISFVTWHLMYFDSAVPGINPPTPLSPSKYRVMSGANFHINFIFAIAIGPVVSTLMFLENA